MRTVCPSSDLVAEVSKRRRAQRSHQGVSRVGGRGSSSPAGNRAGAKRRRAHAVHETARNGPVEGHLLAEGALGRRSRHSSRGGGGGGLGLLVHSVFTSGSGEVTRASERGVSSTQDGEQPACVRGDAERSGPRGVNSSILRRGSRAELQAEPGCSSLRCGLQKPARRICGVQLRPSGLQLHGLARRERRCSLTGKPQATPRERVRDTFVQRYDLAKHVGQGLRSQILSTAKGASGREGTPLNRVVSGRSWSGRSSGDPAAVLRSRSGGGVGRKLNERLGTSSSASSRRQGASEA